MDGDCLVTLFVQFGRDLETSPRSWIVRPVDEMVRRHFRISVTLEHVCAQLYWVLRIALVVCVALLTYTVVSCSLQ